MANQRGFSLEFKRHIVQELLSGESTRPSSAADTQYRLKLLYRWKHQYSWGKFDNEPTEEDALKDRVEKLERLVGKLTLESEFLRVGGGSEQPQSVPAERALISRWRPAARRA